MNASVPWRLRDVAMLFALGVTALLMLALAALGLYRLQGPPNVMPAMPPPALQVIAANVFYLVILAGVWILVVRRYGTPWATIGLRLPDRNVLGAVPSLVAVLAVGCAASIVATVALLAAVGVKTDVAPLTTVPAPSDPLFAVALFGAIVITPIAEEVLFRGLLYQVLRQKTGIVCGTAGSALLFAVLHMRPAAAPALLVLGIVLAAAFERTRSLYPAIAMHAAYNGVIVLLALHVI